MNLKANFVAFRFNRTLNKYELSTNRLEYDTIENCIFLGKHYQDIKNKREFFGLGCISVFNILSTPHYTIAFTPDLKSNPQNPSHSDIYEDSEYFEVPSGQAIPYEIKLKREALLKMWNAFRADEGLKKQDIQPIT